MVEDTRVFGVSKTARVERKTMEKTEFTYQRFNLRIGLSLLVLPVVQIIRSIIVKMFEINDGRYIILSAVLTGVGLILYYRWTENSPCFLKKGYYWEENGTVYIQRGQKIRTIKKVNWLRGTDTFSYHGRVSMLIVQCEKKKTVVYGKTVEDKDDFSSAELYPLYQLILKNNPKLEKDENLPYWYERKKEC